MMPCVLVWSGAKKQQKRLEPNPTTQIALPPFSPPPPLGDAVDLPDDAAIAVFRAWAAAWAAAAAAADAAAEALSTTTAADSLRTKRFDSMTGLACCDMDDTEAEILPSTGAAASLRLCMDWEILPWASANAGFAESATSLNFAEADLTTSASLACSMSCDAEVHVQFKMD